MSKTRTVADMINEGRRCRERVAANYTKVFMGNTTMAEVKILGIDPGPERTAYALLRNGKPGVHDWFPNEGLLAMLLDHGADGCHLAIETLHPRGEPVSRQAMLGQLWAGRFIQAAGAPFTCVDDDDARFAASGKPGATARDVRIGLLNIFGEDKQRPCDCNDGRVPGKRAGTTKICPRCHGDKWITVPGPLASFGEHERSALACALYVWQNRVPERPV